MRDIEVKPQNKLLPLYLVAITTIIGPMIYFKFASLYHFVVIAIFLLIFFRGINIVQNTTPIITFLIIWMLESVISLIWAPDKGLALQYVYYIFLIFAMCIAFHYYINSREAIEKYAEFMVWVLFVLNIIAIWETMTGNHLVKDYLSSDVRLRLLKYVPGTFYRNPNDFATFVIQIIPFSLWLSTSPKKVISILAIINIAVSLFSVSAAQSRTQIILLIGIYILYVIFTQKTKILKFMAVGFVAVIVVYAIYPSFRELVNEALLSIGGEEIMDSTQEGGSLGKRIAMMKNGVYMLLDTFGFGVGAGCHRVLMSEYAAKYFSTNNILVMHNLLAEIFVDYGLFVGFAFVWMNIKAIRNMVLIAQKANDSSTKLLSRFLSIVILFFIICALSSSSIIQQTSLWMTICFISAFIRFHLENINNEVDY